MIAEPKTQMDALVAAARWAHDKLNEDHDTCDCTCVACCGCFTEWLGKVKNYEEWCPLGAVLRDIDAQNALSAREEGQ